MEITLEKTLYEGDIDQLVDIWKLSLGSVEGEDIREKINSNIPYLARQYGMKIEDDTEFPHFVRLYDYKVVYDSVDKGKWKELKRHIETHGTSVAKITTLFLHNYYKNILLAARPGTGEARNYRNSILRDLPPILSLLILRMPDSTLLKNLLINLKNILYRGDYIPYDFDGDDEEYYMMELISIIQEHTRKEDLELLNNKLENLYSFLL